MSNEASQATGRATTEEIPGTIYVLCSGEAVKIGYTRGDPRERMSNLQTGNARRLAIAASWPGSQADETALHQRFARYRVSGEWFRVTDEIEIFIFGKQGRWLTGWEVETDEPAVAIPSVAQGSAPVKSQRRKEYLRNYMRDYMQKRRAK